MGLQLDTKLRFREHVSGLIRRAYCHLRVLYGNRQCLDFNLRKLLCESLVLSHFNFCVNVYYPCLDSYDRLRIQRVQNSCLRFIYGLRRYDHVSHALGFAKWLNMSRRAELLATIFYYKIIYFKKPSYLYRKVVFRSDVHAINVRFRGHLSPPSHCLEMYKRSFSYNIVKLYNALPIHIRSLRPASFVRSLRRMYREVA